MQSTQTSWISKLEISQNFNSLSCPQWIVYMYCQRWTRQSGNSSFSINKLACVRFYLHAKISPKYKFHSSNHNFVCIIVLLPNFFWLLADVLVSIPVFVNVRIEKRVEMAISSLIFASRNNDILSHSRFVFFFHRSLFCTTWSPFSSHYVFLDLFYIRFITMH